MDEIILELNEKMDNAVEAMERNFSTVRTGRANPKILDKIMVDYYGVSTALTQLATVSVPEARQLLVKPFDKNALGEIERSINESNLGLTPNNDGYTIRLVIPQLTEERRKELVKQVKSITEDGKIALRNARHEALNKAKNSDMSEDEVKGLEKRVQDEINKYNKKVEEKFKEKEGELLEV
jgi:ribosome recycling factor